jgi:tape measure domain-containing protein
MEDLSEFAMQSSFDLPDVVSNAKQLMGMGIELENVIPTMKMLGDTAAGLGVPLQRLALNFGQVKSQGKLTGRELRDFAISGVPLLETLANSMGKTKQEITAMVSESKIGFSDVRNAFIAMTSEGGKFNNLMQRTVNETLLGKWSNFKDVLFRVKSEFGKGLLPVATNALQSIIDQYSTLQTETRLTEEGTLLLRDSYLALGDEKVMEKLAAVNNELRDMQLALETEAQPSWFLSFVNSLEKLAGIPLAPFKALSNVFISMGTDIAKTIDDVTMGMAGDVFGNFTQDLQNLANWLGIDQEEVERLSNETIRLRNELSTLLNQQWKTDIGFEYDDSEDETLFRKLLLQDRAGMAMPSVNVPIDVEFDLTETPFNEQFEGLGDLTIERTDIETFSSYVEKNRQLTEENKLQNKWNEKIKEQYPELAAAMGLVENSQERMTAQAQAWASQISDVLYQSFNGQFDNIEDRWKNMLKRMAADFAVSGLFSLFGAPGGVGMFGEGNLFGGLFHNGGSVKNNAGTPVRAASGMNDFVVPSGYPNDSFPIMVESGEHVNVTSAANTRSGFNEIASKLDAVIATIKSKPVAYTRVLADEDIYKRSVKGRLLTSEL